MSRTLVSKLALSASVLLLLVGAAYVVRNSAAPATALAAFSEAQIQSILSVLSAFGVDQAVLGRIDSALRGAAPEPPAATPAPATPDVSGVEPAVESPAPTTTSMTGEAAVLRISVSPTPAAGNAPSGTKYFHVASYLFDATDAGEDIRFTALKFLYTDEALYDPYNCAVYSGPEEFMPRYTKGSLNPYFVHPAGTGDKAFTLTTALIIPKGGKKLVDIRCDFNSRAFRDTGSFSWGLSSENGAATFTGVGVTSGEVVTPKSETDVGNRRTFSS